MKKSFVFVVLFLSIGVACTKAGRTRMPSSIEGAMLLTDSDKSLYQRTELRKKYPPQGLASVLQACREASECITGLCLKGRCSDRVKDEGCIDNGDATTDQSRCCSQNMNANHLCYPQTVGKIYLSYIEQPCNGDSGCISGSCINFSCVPSKNECAFVDMKCTSSADCCSKNCSEDPVGSRKCLPSDLDLAYPGESCNFPGQDLGCYFGKCQAGSLKCAPRK